MSQPPSPSSSAANNSPAKSAYANRLANIHILIIISSERAADLVKRLFINLGFTNLYVAYDAAEAISFLSDVQMHLIVTDADLKVTRIGTDFDREQSGQETILLSGVQFVYRLRNSPASPAPYIPVLMLMDSARNADVLKARDVGVNEIVLKPLEAKNFCERIIALIDNPRPYITASTYRGPCRRRKEGPPIGQEERRVREVRLVRCDEMKGTRT